MALIGCSECGKEISDQAEVCPNCGVKTQVGKHHDIVIKEGKYKDFEIVWAIVGIINTIIACIITYNIYINASWWDINYNGQWLLLKILFVWGVNITIDVLLNSMLKRKKQELESKTGQVHEVKKENTWKCPNCGGDNPAIFSYCTYCTSKKPRFQNTSQKSVVTNSQTTSTPTATAAVTSQQPSAISKFCSSCGEKLQEGVRFCPNCGRNVNDTSTGNTASQDYIGQARDAARRAANTVVQKGSQAVNKAKGYIDSKKQ